MAGLKRSKIETLLRVRQRQEDIKALALAAARRAEAAAAEQRARIAEEQRRTLEGARDTARDRFDAGDVRRFYQYERHLARLATEKDARIQELRGVIDVRRRELEDATKNKKVIEKLKERQELARRKTFAKFEQHLMNEVASNYHELRRRGGRPAKERRGSR